MKKKDFTHLNGHLDICFKKYISKKAFPGASLGYFFIHHNEIIRNIFYYGNIDKTEKGVDKKTFFDLASLTKPFVTVLCLLCLIKEKKIDWKTRLDSLLDLTLSEKKKNITLIQLMSHSSGLPAHRKYHEKLKDLPIYKRKRKIVEWIVDEKLEYMPGYKSIYSDLGYILLGYIVEKVSGRSLHEFWFQRIAMPLSLQDKFCFPIEKERDSLRFASTSFIFNEKNRTFPCVHDENSRALGGVAGHAGLFGTAEGVVSLCETILQGWHNNFNHPSYSNDDLRMALKKVEKLDWTPGFDTPASFGSSSGHYFSKTSVGHLGYTGTSFWIDLEKRVGIVLLTNRVFWGEDNTLIKKIRPDIQDIIMKDLL